MVISPLADLQPDLDRVEAALTTLLNERGGWLRPQAERLFRTGGKRLRPAMVLLTARLFGQVDEAVIKVAAAVEMIHGASLLHDDVIDETDTRRGSPTLNSEEGNRFAVLLGDFLLCQALLGVSDLGRVDLLQVISQAVADMTSGQILEADLQGDVEASEEAYLQVIDGKTAALMAAGCEMAAMACGADPEEVDAARRLGRFLGLAFQIVDDILDLWGDPTALGKPVGSDLQDKKFTLPFLVSYRQSNEQERARVRSLVSNGHYPGEHLPELIDWMDRHRARNIASAKAEEYTAHARQALSRLPEGPTRTELDRLLNELMERKR